MKTTIHIYNTRKTWLMLCLLLSSLQVKALDKIGNVDCIYDATELNEIGKLVADGETNANGMLMNDIDFSGWTSWEPIGGRGTGNPNPYCGHFDGGGHRIKNLVVDNASKGWSSQGVFGGQELCGRNSRSSAWRCGRYGEIRQLRQRRQCKLQYD